MYVCMYVCMYVYMYVCMYVCMHIYIHTDIDTYTSQTTANLWREETWCRARGAAKCSQPEPMQSRAAQRYASRLRLKQRLKALVPARCRGGEHRSQGRQSLGRLGLGAGNQVKVLKPRAAHLVYQRLVSLSGPPPARARAHVHACTHTQTNTRARTHTHT